MKYFFIFSFFISSQLLMAQDERLFRSAVLGAFVPVEEKRKIPRNYFYKSNSPMYRLDLTGNGYKEGIVIEKIDGENWIHLHNYTMKRSKSFPLEAKGINSRAYKLVLKQISPTIRILLVYFYEGYAKYLDFHASARIYIITIKNGDINSSVITKGPQYFEESEEIFKRYYLKSMKIFTKDIDFDGVKEIILSKHLMTRVLSIGTDGKWYDIVNKE